VSHNLNFHQWRRYAAGVFVLVAVLTVASLLWFSNSLVRDLALQERERVRIWADATRQIATAPSGCSDDETSRLNFLLGIVRANTTIPVLLVDDSGNILDHRNFSLPEPVDSMAPFALSEANERYLRRKLSALDRSRNVIHLAVAPGENQHIYYEESRLLRRLSAFPYVMLGVLSVFMAVAYLAIRSSRRAEQNRLWVGFSKETAHQLGTPISSLLAWTELMRSMDIDPDMVSEMEKDVDRLSTVASRFSKIGSRPALEPADIGVAVKKAVAYMRSRISGRVEVNVTDECGPVMVMMSEPLLQWVVENLLKNAVDAMEGVGRITLTIKVEDNSVAVYVADTGRGMNRKVRKHIFRPGFTTKKRGWGLGLALARRIVEQYHGGRIQVVSSSPGLGTTFRFTIPLNRL